MSVTITQGPRGTVTVVQASRTVSIVTNSRSVVTVAKVGTQGVPGPVAPPDEGPGIDVVGNEIRLDIDNLPIAPGT